MFFGQIFVKNAKMTLEHFLNGPNRTKIENPENAEILVNNIKSCRFGHSERQNSAVFEDSDLKFCTQILQQVSLYTYSVFFIPPPKKKNNPGKLWKTKHFDDYFPQFSKISKYETAV